MDQLMFGNGRLSEEQCCFAIYWVLNELRITSKRVAQIIDVEDIIRGWEVNVSAAMKEGLNFERRNV